MDKNSAVWNLKEMALRQSKADSHLHAQPMDYSSIYHLICLHILISLHLNVHVDAKHYIIT